MRLRAEGQGFGGHVKSIFKNRMNDHFKLPWADVKLKETRDGNMTIKVIGAGFGRTGTDSLREALTILGFGPCHHMFEVDNNPDQQALWRRRALGDDIPLTTLLDGYHACVDWPSSFYWRELSNLYPDAKVILSLRDPEAWWTSFSRTILNPIMADKNVGETVGWNLIGKQVFDGQPDDRDTAISAFVANTKAVRGTIAADRLLEYQPGDGWDPLCAFLSVPVPDQPYPSRNSTQDFKARRSE